MTQQDCVVALSLRYVPDEQLLAGNDLYLTLRLLMSYIYGAPSKVRNANVVYIYGPTFGNTETVSFYLLHNVSTLNQCREVSCIDSVLKHCAANRKRLFQRCQT